MPIDIERAVGASLPATTFGWSDEDVILYHLGLGAGRDPIDPVELRYVYEGDLVVLPTYANIPAFPMVMGLGAVEGVDINLAQILHGEQDTLVHSRIPTSGTVDSEGSIVAIYDKGKGALVVVETVSTLRGADEPIFTNLSRVYVKGEGGFGGDPGPSARSGPPDREPERTVESPTLPQQALLYRMASGDRNPLHADPGFASFAGFERPILHGLCTYGVVCKAIVDAALGSDPTVVGSFEGRFAGVVFPGETISTRIWDEGDIYRAEAMVVERGERVLTNAVLALR